ncbi:MAG: hypothetical protein R6X02_35090 [Enhygromyxa sp.]
MLDIKRVLRSSLALLLSLPMVIGTTACKSGNTAQRLAETTAPTLEGSTGKCKPGGEASKSLVVEWPMGDRAALEGRVKERLVAVRYRNCEMELITNCSVQGNYRYISVTPKSENVRITNADELYARIPIGAVKLEGQLARAGELNVDMVLVGRHEASAFRFQVDDLDGRCEGATHVVTGLSVGAFVFYSGAGANIGIAGGVKGTGVEAGAGSTADRQMLSRDGSIEACYGPPTEDGGPPPGCAALLQVEVVPIDRPEVQASSSNTKMGQLTDTTAVAGENLTTDKLDKQIRATAFVTLSGYVIAATGIALGVVGLRLNGTYKADTAGNEVGIAGTEERAKYVSRFTLSQGFMYGGLAGAVVGLGLGLWGSVRVKKLRNERSTRLAGIELVPSREGLFLGAQWRF